MSSAPTFLTPLRATVALTTIAVGLWVDQAFEVWGQIAVSLWVWGLYLWFAQRAAPADRRMMVKCLLIATVGEGICSLLWGLYDYRLYNIPPFVPPGHVLMLMAGMTLAQRLSLRYANALALLALIGITGAMLLTHDWLSLPFLTLFGLLWIFSPAQRPVFAVMLLLALGLELYGTWVGNWTWKPVAPWLELSAHNPPFASSVLYCLLDCLTLQVGVSRWRGWRLARKGAASFEPIS
ncbi:MAG: hypothetical protein EPO06_00210 [Burkholderiaceae bacterium]|nr:MAG: hypothetical protein EPO06_00210 [Burkholderiaceae bacterium]